ncbi:MAG: hypothetical protein H0W56_00295 [Acidothermales bacterium]|jgi:ABC-type taurine transport system ATPase subunit|nr:hypothetical protein [Acidothermales bacterium]
MNHDLSPASLREVAQHVHDVVIPALDSVSDAAFPLEKVDLRRFPRESEEAQAAKEGLLSLRESLEQTAAQLFALAVVQEVARDRDITLPPALFAVVEPFLAVDRAPEEKKDATSVGTPDRQ